ncbi:MAG: hypothetical protein J0L53_01715 [Spirochaetes bacterium]|nr:hypothetical protein [Spirochaetota bacterium]
MKKITIYTLLLGVVFAPIAAQNYSSYRYMASKRYGKCLIARNYNGKDFSPNTLMRKYNCQAQENDQLGGLILKCQMPEGSTAFVFAESESSCQSALRAIMGM